MFAWVKPDYGFYFPVTLSHSSGRTSPALPNSVKSAIWDMGVLSILISTTMAPAAWAAIGNDATGYT